MSVLKTQRRVSTYQFWQSFVAIYKHHSNIIGRVPIRKQKWICQDINFHMREAYSLLSEASSKYVRNPNLAFYKDATFLQAINHLENMQDGLLVFWNIQKYSYRSMRYWATMINDEIDLIKDSMSTQPEEYKYIQILDWDRIEKCMFLQNMCVLHRFVHGKIIRVPNRYDDTISKQIIDYIDKAFINVMKANIDMPQTKAQYTARRKLISDAIEYLQESEYPLYELFNIMQYSENVMKEFSDLLTSEIKLLKGLQKSDAERFKGLK